MDTPLAFDETVRSRADVMVRAAGDGLVLVDMGSGLCWELNQVGAAVWAALETAQTLAEVCRALQGRYPVSPDVLEHDVLALGRSLFEAGLLRRAADAG
jgi:hypothetical protein